MNTNKYIEFNLVCQKPKTQVYVVRNIKSQSIIGYIKWLCAWRQYCFFPEPDTVYSVGCLQDIIEFINKEAELKRANLKDIIK